MTALHVEHRSQEALEVYADARAVLADELGIEPSEALQRIEAAILKDDAGRRDPELGDQAVPREAARLPVPRTPDVRPRRADRLHRAQPATTRTPGWSP